jgi:hypothetical protein
VHSRSGLDAYSSRRADFLPVLRLSAGVHLRAVILCPESCVVGVGYVSGTRPIIKSIMGFPGAKEPVRLDMVCP